MHSHKQSEGLGGVLWMYKIGQRDRQTGRQAGRQADRNRLERERERDVQTYRLT